MAQPTFDPAAHPPLIGLGERLPELAGAAAYRAGRTYLRKGVVKEAAVASTTAYATVVGSTDYRVSVQFASTDETIVTCTCPAHRRSKHCKHVVAVCGLLIEQPGAVAVLEAPPEGFFPPRVAKGPRAPRRTAAEKARAEQEQAAALRAAGLATIDRLLTELADGGLLALGPDKATLLEGVAELVRALKLRRLGNLLMHLQRAVANPGSLDGPRFARLLIDLHLAREATGAHLNGRASLDPRLAEDLLGKAWRATELEPVSDLDLIEVGFTREDALEFVVETSYVADPAGGELYAEREITPAGRRAAPKPRRRLRLRVEEAGLYPGLSPRRIRLARFNRAPLRAEDVDRLIDGAVDDLAVVRRRLGERAAVPFGRPELAVLFRPAALLAPPSDSVGGIRQAGGALDGAGRFVALRWSRALAKSMPEALPADGRVALFGLVTLGASDETGTDRPADGAAAGLCLDCHGVLGAAPADGLGRIITG